MVILRLIAKNRRILLWAIDVVTIFVAYIVAAFLMRIAAGIIALPSHTLSSLFGFAVLSAVGMWALGVYKNVWRYARAKDFLGCIFGNVLGAVASFIVCVFMNNTPAELCIILGCLLSICCIVVLRIFYSYLYGEYRRVRTGAVKKQRILIIGAGFAGAHILDEFQRNTDKYEVVGLIDDDENKIGRNVNGAKVLGDCTMIPKIAEKMKVNDIVLAVPSISPKDKNRIIGICSETVCNFKILPSVQKLMREDFVKQLAPIKIEDLLGRDEVNFDDRAISRLVSGSVCMVTGGGGSIGSELCRQIALYNPKRLVIVDIYENNAYDIQQELVRMYKDKLNLSVEIASVRDISKMNMLFKKYGPDIVFHAAAHKHVPLMETNPEEAVKNNILGTYNTALLSAKYEVEKFVLISTDKAVNPTNIMGATKRFCEMIVEYFAQKHTKTEFVAVRFGNVLGSNGSVIPLFEKQIAEGGPITVTHSEIVRYFMTIPEAVSLILQAATLARGGEIFVLDMGEQVKILDLAKKMITLHGKQVGKDIKIEFTGLRPGEKLYEELLMDEEGLKETSNHKIYIGKQMRVDEEIFLKQLDKLKNAADSNDKDMVEEILHECVPTFIRKEQKSVV